MSLSNLKIGIVTPTYDRPELLKRAIESVLKQTYKNWFMVVVNDCSNSSYDEIITLFRDERIVFLCNQFNSGVNFSRNLALEKLEELNCDFITFLDDDDYFENKSIFEHVLNDSIKNNDVDWLIYEVKNVCMDSESTDYKEFDLDYINDYLYGSVLIGDKHHFIKSHLAKGKRFSSFISNGYEWIYFIQLANSRTKYFSKVVKCVEYQQNGLTQKGQLKKPRNIILQTLLPIQVWLRRPYNVKAFRRMIFLTLKLPFRLLRAVFY